MLFDLALAGGGQFDGHTLQLPASLGEGFIKMLEPESGLRLLVHSCCLAHEMTIRRRAEDTPPDTWLLAFSVFDSAPRAKARPLSSVHLASAGVDISSTMPAHTALLIVAMAINKSLLHSWLRDADGTVPAILSSQHPVVLDALMTPAMEKVLSHFAQARPASSLEPFFLKIKAQELLYWLFQELAERAAAPVRPIHADDVQKIYQVREALLAHLDEPPSLPRLARQAGLSETKMKGLFRQVFGASLYSYFQVARMEEAKRLLGELSVSQVGGRLGFSNLSHFARLFEKHHGQTPKKYQTQVATHAPSR